MLMLDNLIAVKSETAPRFNIYPYILNLFENAMDNTMVNSRADLGVLFIQS